MKRPVGSLQFQVSGFLEAGGCGGWVEEKGVMSFEAATASMWASVMADSGLNILSWPHGYLENTKVTLELVD